MEEPINTNILTNAPQTLYFKRPVIRADYYLQK